MDNVSDFANEFAKRARAGKKPTVKVEYQYAEAFLGELARLGFAFARESLKQISDPALRRIVETLFFSTVAGAAAGLAVGVAIETIPVAKAVAVGAAVGYGSGLLALMIVARDEPQQRRFVFSIK